MKASEAIKQAIRTVNELIAKADGGELAVYQEFAEEFDAVIEGWEMRIQELTATNKETDA